MTTDLKETIAKAIYGVDPIMEQPVDMDNRPTGTAGAIPWNVLPEIDDGYHEHFKSLAQAVISALDEAGYVVVPREPTEAATKG